jgi:UDP-N-acetylmuramoyl-tripeptide--D-alanyl-D-alanine ligase
LRPASMRGEILHFRDGFVAINDCYNSNPLALEKMVDLLCTTPGYQRRILVAGAWREIGPSSVELHRLAGKQIAERRAVDWIIGVDGDAQELVCGAIEAGHPREHTKFFETSEEAASFVTELVAPGDLLLVKGSRGVRLEKVAAALEERYALAADAEEMARADSRNH